jgi:hypothetical protein
MVLIHLVVEHEAAMEQGPETLIAFDARLQRSPILGAEPPRVELETEVPEKAYGAAEGHGSHPPRAVGRRRPHVHPGPLRS